jgi:thymidylate kinase
MTREPYIRQMERMQKARRLRVTWTNDYKQDVKKRFELPTRQTDGRFVWVETRQSLTETEAEIAIIHK